MITGFFLQFLALIIESIAKLLGVIPAPFSANFLDATRYFAAYMGYFSGIINWADIIDPIIFFLNFLIGWYTFKLIMWMWHLIPAIGKKDQFHNFSGKKK